MLEIHNRVNVFFTARHLVHETENEFALTPGVGGAYKAVNVRAAHKAAKGVKLLFFTIENNVFPSIWYNRQILAPPFAVLFVVFICVCK